MPEDKGLNCLEAGISRIHSVLNIVVNEILIFIVVKIFSLYCILKGLELSVICYCTI
jgi:ammonia channel protein AmtB